MAKLMARALDAQYDLVIRNGRVLDGAGNPWIIADVAIDKRRFVKIGKITSHIARSLLLDLLGA